MENWIVIFSIAIVGIVAFGAGVVYSMYFTSIEVAKIENLERKFGASVDYFYIGNLKHEGEKIDLLLTRQELNTAIGRAEANSEDF